MALLAVAVLAAVLASVQPLRGASASPTAKMYWTDQGTYKIQRSNLDGSGVEDLVTPAGEVRPGGIAIDMSAGKMYWTDDLVDKIQRANLDGSGVEEVVTHIVAAPQRIALDVAGGKMYWTLAGADYIQRANLNGIGGVGYTPVPFRGTGIALDVTGGKMYWTVRASADMILRANLNGSGVEYLVTTGLRGASGIALDVAAGKMYWTDLETQKIQQANLDGSGVIDLVTGVGAADIALDVTCGRMYWTNPGTDNIQRAKLDGSGVEDLVITGLNNPIGIALDITPPRDCVAVGGIVGLQTDADAPVDAANSSSARGSYVQIAALAVGAIVTLGAGGWYARRRRLR